MPDPHGITRIAGPGERPGTPAAPDHSEHRGDQIGPYRLLEILGEGGFGTVWLAERREPFVQRVALKIIKAGMDTRAVIARFEQERQALAVMDHPGVAKVHDAGTTQRGRPYFVMEHVPGEPITSYCDKHRLTIAQRLELFIPVCEAVQHAHMKGIIHRDLKPGNILVAPPAAASLTAPTPDGRSSLPTVKVIDFGVAKAVSHTLTDKTIYTETGQLIGTPEYMSPEQAEMRGSDIDTRSDVYSLGVVLYELLAGQPPFDSDRLRSAGYAEIQRVIRETDPPKPSARLSHGARATRPPAPPSPPPSFPPDPSTPAPSNALVPGADVTEIATRRRTDPRSLTLLLKRELDWIPLRALRKDRAERYGSPSDLARDIRNYLEGRPLEAGPESASYRFKKLVRRNKGPFAAAGALVLTMALGLAGTIWKAREADAQRAEALRQATLSEQSAKAARASAAEALEQKAEAQRQRLAAEASAALEARARRRAETINSFVTTSLKSSDPQNAGGSHQTTVLEAMDNALKDIAGGRFKDDPQAEADLLSTIATIMQNNGNAPGALPHYQRSLDIRRQLFPGDHADVAASTGFVAACLDELGRSDEALPLHEEALEMYQRLLPPDSPDIAVSLGNLAICLDRLGRPAESLPRHQAGLEILRRLYPQGHRDISSGLSNAAFSLHSLGRTQEALPLVEESLRMIEALFPGDHPHVASSLNNLAMCLDSLERWDEALPKYKRALEMLQRLFPGDHPGIATDMSNMAGCLDNLGRSAEALPLHTAALEMDKRLYPGDHPDVAVGTMNMARCLDDLGRPAEALPMHESGLEMCRRLFPGVDHPMTVAATYNLARCLSALDRTPEALERAREAAAMAARLFAQDHRTRKKCDALVAEIEGKTATHAPPPG